jgi:predicted ATP-binding protein involved in virulence
MYNPAKEKVTRVRIMYIKRIYLKNIRCFKEFEINFDKTRGSILILGDNGDGKSTLLRTLAMGLCDESSAAGLLRELPGELVRKNCGEDGLIIIELENKKRKYKIETAIESLAAFERVKQKVYLNGKKSSQDSFPWQDIFVCGYGAGRQTQGTADLEEYTAVDAVYTLFRYYDPMQNSELAIRRLVEKARSRAGKNPKEKERHAERMLEHIRGMLKHVLDLDEKDKVIITPTGIEIKSHWGRNKLGSLGDGYKATITWIMDFLSWRMLSMKSIDPLRMTGIALIDEIEQHLHPRWQINIMKLLQESFPKIQFVATTHSPLVASGCEHCTVYALRRGKKEIIENVYGWLAEDVYRYIMGLPSSRPMKFKNEIIDKYRTLYRKKINKKLSENEKSEIKSLRQILDSLPGSDPIALSTELNSITDELKILKVNK